MDNNNQKQPANTPPVIPESELKLPDEGVDGVAPVPPPKHSINPLLVALLVLLLAILAAVIIWGEELIGLVFPGETVELPPLSEEQVGRDNLSEMTELEAEIEQNEAELDSLEQEMNQLETEINVELEAEATATGTVSN